MYHTGRRTPYLSDSNTTQPLNPSAPLLTTPPWLTAVRAAESKKALDIRVLDLREVTTFADFFVICSGSNPKQIQAIVEEIGQQLDQTRRISGQRGRLRKRRMDPGRLRRLSDSRLLAQSAHVL